MSPETVRALRAINERFYRTEAELFASKRTRPWAGMERVLQELPRRPDSVLDVGCGHGRFAAQLHALGMDPDYLGVDGSAALLELAAARSDLPARCRFLEVDILEAPRAIPEGPFDLIALFGVLHHVPGEARRQTLLRSLGERVAPGGTLALAFWRARGDDVARQRPWSDAGLCDDDVEPGDRLLSFDRRPDVFRYAHFADDAELVRVEPAPGLPLALRFTAGDAANAYFIWRRPG
ncbi:MAG: class I SAM-dependent methyltransferase [bacterium]|nr:class I SAM-dependent methyltransferase [bacterium]MCP5066768.1 class I SAM-dependent methyltransferase [bacterium]